MYEIFVDVSVDMEESFYNENDVKFVGMEYMIGDEVRHCDRPESTEYLREYYEKLRNKVPTKTSQISPYNYVETFKPYVNEGKEILYLSLSSGLSNTYESANMAVKMIKEEYPDASIEVVDTLGATGGMGILVEAAFKNRDDGLSLSENANWLREHASNVNFWFMVEDLMYLKRGGRISATSAVMGSALSIKPILTINSEGKLETVAKKRGKKLAMKGMIDYMKEGYNSSLGDMVYISGADCPNEQEELKNMVLESFPDVKVRLTSMSPIIGAHTGADMMALIYMGNKRK